MITTNRVLVVDDNSTLNDLIAKYFEKYGFLPDQACTFLDAKKLLEKESYDLITLDWELDEGKIRNRLASIYRQFRKSSSCEWSTNLRTS